MSDSSIVLNKIYCEDCIDFMTKIPNDFVDLVVADPPYYKVLSHAWDNQWDNEKDYLTWCSLWVKEVYRVLKTSGSFYIFGDLDNDVFLYLLVKIQKKLGFIRKNIVIWCKNTGLTAVKNKYIHDTEAIGFFIKSKAYTYNQQRMNQPSIHTYFRYRKCDFDNDGIIYIGDLQKGGENFKYAQVTNFGQKDTDKFLDINIPNKLCKDYWIDISNLHEKKKGGLKDTFSVAAKPEKLIERIILSSSNEQDLILDFFMGSGTTAVMAKKLGRNFIGCDMNQEYVNLGNKRLENV